MVAAGFKAPISDNLRAEIWLKFIGNLAFNPISALTHATLEGLTRYPLTRDLSFQMMTEGETIATKLGVTMRVGIEKRIAGAEKVGAHKTSMLQDVEHGRPLELEALVGAVIELGRLTAHRRRTSTRCTRARKLLAQTIADAKGTLRITDDSRLRRTEDQ